MAAGGGGVTPLPGTGGVGGTPLPGTGPRAGEPGVRRDPSLLGMVDRRLCGRGGPPVSPPHAVVGPRGFRLRLAYRVEATWSRGLGRAAGDPRAGGSAALSRRRCGGCGAASAFCAVSNPPICL